MSLPPLFKFSSYGPADVIKEGDGDHIMRYWRYLLPSGRKNYANEVSIMLYQHDYALSKRHAAQLKWMRCINVHGRTFLQIYTLNPLTVLW